jgi:hypothetical protein
MPLAGVDDNVRRNWENLTSKPSTEQDAPPSPAPARSMKIPEDTGDSSSSLTSAVSLSLSLSLSMCECVCARARAGACLYLLAQRQDLPPSPACAPLLKFRGVLR